MDQGRDNARELAHLFKVIADETRLRILGLLAVKPLADREIAESLHLAPANVSQHVRKLVEAGVLTSTFEARLQRYALNRELLFESRRLAIDDLDHAPLANSGDSDEDRETARIIENFFDGDRLTSMPARQQQRLVVLAHLASGFERDRDYPEREVNDILRRADPDVAMLRRALVDYGFMTRDHGNYSLAVCMSEPAQNIPAAKDNDNRG